MLQGMQRKSKNELYKEKPLNKELSFCFSFEIFDF
jgi:hypothetical protein